MYAIVETGGKQYRVSSGEVIDVDRMDVYEGDTVELDKVLLMGDGENVTIGNPTIEGARVIATSQGENRSKKILVLHYKPKVRYHKKNGHRQSYTRLVINDIIGPGGGTTDPAKKPRRRKKEVTESGA